MSLRKVTKSETEEGEIENKPVEQASSAETLPSGELNSTGEECTKEEVTDKIAEGKSEQHSAPIREKVEDLQKLKLGRTTLRKTGPDQRETSEVESEREKQGALQVKAGVPGKTEDTISESSSSRATTRTSPLEEPFRLKSVVSGSPRRKDLPPEPEPVPHIEQVQLRKTGLIKTKTKKEELEETNLQTTPLLGTEKDDNAEATRIPNQLTDRDAKVKTHPEKGKELTKTEELHRKKSSTVNEANKHTTEKPKTPTEEIAEEMHDRYPGQQKETDKKAEDVVFGRTSLRKTGLDLETLKPKSQRDRDDEPKAEDKKETKLRSGNIRESARTEESELKSVSPLPLISPQPLFMEEVKLKKTGLIKRNTEDEESKVVGSVERIPGKNEEETRNLRTVPENENCEDQEEEIADESKELSVENKPRMKEERVAKEEQRIIQGQAALRKTGLDIGKLTSKSQELKNDRPETETDISKVKHEGTLKSSAGESPSTGQFQLKSVASSLSRGKEMEPSSHIEQVKLRKTYLTEKGIQKEESESAHLHEISENLNDDARNEFHLQESAAYAPEKETSKEGYGRPSPSRTTQNVEKDQPSSRRPLAKEHGENARPAKPQQDGTEKTKARQDSPNQDATELELVTLKPVSRSVPTRDKVSHSDSSKAEDEEMASFEKDEFQKYSSGTQIVRKESKESDTSKQTTKPSSTELGEETETRENVSTSSSSAASRQTSPSPEPVRLKLLTPRSVRTGERSPEPVPHIQQVKLKKTSIVKREIPKEELENVDLQETMYGVKDNEESDGMIKLKNVPEKENASSKADRESAEYNSTEIKFDDLPDRFKLSSSDFERQSVAPVTQEKTNESEHRKATGEESSQDADEEVTKGKYQRGYKNREDQREDKTKIVVEKGKLPDERDVMETVVLKPVPVSKSVAPTKNVKQHPGQEDEKPMFGLKSRAKACKNW